MTVLRNSLFTTNIYLEIVAWAQFLEYDSQKSKDKFPTITLYNASCRCIFPNLLLTILFLPSLLFSLFY